MRSYVVYDGDTQVFIGVLLACCHYLEENEMYSNKEVFTIKIMLPCSIKWDKLSMEEQVYMLTNMTLKERTIFNNRLKIKYS